MKMEFKKASTCCLAILGYPSSYALKHLRLIMPKQRKYGDETGWHQAGNVTGSRPCAWIVSPPQIHKYRRRVQAWRPGPFRFRGPSLTLPFPFQYRRPSIQAIYACSGTVRCPSVSSRRGLESHLVSPFQKAPDGGCPIGTRGALSDGFHLLSSLSRYVYHLVRIRLLVRSQQIDSAGR